MKSDLNLLEEFGDALRPATDDPPAELRHRVLHGMAHRRTTARRLPRTTGARLAWRIGAPAGIAAAIAAAMIAGQAANVAGNAPGPPPGAAGSGGQAQPAGAQQVLRLAAQQAATTPLLAARPDQYLYIRSVEVESRDGKVVGPYGVGTWHAVDGTRDGLVLRDENGGKPARTRLSGCVNGLQAETIDRPGTTPKVPCTPKPAYQPAAVPADPAELLNGLYHPKVAAEHYIYVGRMQPPVDMKAFIKLSADQRVFGELARLLGENHSPAVHATVFQAAARIPGVRVRTGATDASGRGGVAVARTEAGISQELVFAAGTYRYLGENEFVADFDLSTATYAEPKNMGQVTMRTTENRRAGEVIRQRAIMEIAIVDRAGQRP